MSAMTPPPIPSDHGYPKVQSRRVPYDAPGMDSFRTYPKIGVNSSYQYLGCICPFLFVLLSYPIYRLPIFRGSFEAPMILGVAFVSGVSGAIKLVKFLSLRLEAIQAKQDLKTFEADLSEIHIGIAYSEEICYFRHDSSWDRGFLRIKDGVLSFRGFGPRFFLPVTAIIRTWIAVSNAGINSIPRLFVEWNHPVSGSNVFSLEIRNAKDREDCFSRTEELAVLIHAAMSNSQCEVSKPTYPFESRALNLSVYPLAKENV